MEDKTMKKIYTLALILVSIFMFGCAGTGGTKLEVKAAGKSLPFALKSSGTYNSVKTFTDLQSKVTKASANSIVLANFDVDTSAGMSSMGRPLNSNDQVRITLQLIGEEGSDEKAGFKTGTFTTNAEKFLKVDYVNIAYFADGKESVNSFDIRKTAGEVKVSSVSDSSVSGEINLTEGEKTIKGTFTAEITRKK